MHVEYGRRNVIRETVIWNTEENVFPVCILWEISYQWEKWLQLIPYCGNSDSFITFLVLLPALVGTFSKLESA